MARNRINAAAIELTRDLQDLGPPLSKKCCIFRVPKNIRRANEEAYTPQFLSIGPYHHGKEGLKKMEQLKLRYLKKFLKKAEARASMETFIDRIESHEEEIRQCYSERINFDSHKFVKMVLVDAAFIIEYFSMVGQDRTASSNDFPDDEEFDPIIDVKVFKKELRNDLLLLENQLPFFILEELYKLADGPCSSFLKVSLQFLRHKTKYLEIQDVSGTLKVKHITDLLRLSQLSTHHLYSQMQKIDINHGSTRDSKRYVSYRVTELHQAGVKFKKASSKCFLDIEWNESKAVLEIPPFLLHYMTESMIRNIIALEQCCYPDRAFVSDFSFLMDSLIESEKDVELLVQNNILINAIGSHQEAASMVNKLSWGIQRNSENNHYAGIIKALNEHYSKPYNKWIASLRQTYFQTPWVGASTVAAVILLVLTLIQIFCSIIAL